MGDGDCKEKLDKVKCMVHTVYKITLTPKLEFAKTLYKLSLPTLKRVSER